MNSLTEKNALLTYTKDKTMHVQSTTSTNNYLASEGSVTPNTKNLERVWSPNKFNQKKPELLTLALDSPLKISWGCLKQQTSAPMEENKTNTKHPSSQPSPPSPTSSTSSSSSYSDTYQHSSHVRSTTTLTSNTNHPASHIAEGAISPTAGNGPLSPLHHARRPMNAFLIFCKKHRPVVRRKFLSLENRAVTKILGEWWALLEVGEKEAYTTLAREYKDAFFNANPNFKWYKLPAPPLRTLHTRPSTNQLLQQMSTTINNKLSTAISNSTTTTAALTTMAGILTHGHTITTMSSNAAMTATPDKEKGFGGIGGGPYKDGGSGRVEFTPGKLADESQLGKLSSLLKMSSNNNIHMENSNYYSHNNNNYNTENNNNNTSYTSISDSNSTATTPVNKPIDTQTSVKPIKKREFVTNDQNDNLNDMFDVGSNRIFDNSSVKLSDNPFRASENSVASTDKDSVDGSRVARNLFDDEEADGYEERKVGRKCKGRRYREFMINGKLLKNRRDKLSEDDGDDFPQMDFNSQDNSFSRPQQHMDLDTTIKMLAERTHTKLPESPQSQSDNIVPQEYDVNSPIPNSVANSSNSSDGNTNNGNNESFNLDEKIAMLPCLSYEQYVRRKRDSKKRSKFARNREITGKSKVKSMEKSTVATMTPVASVAGLVGSKKRKNKQNITHLKGKNSKEFIIKENKLLDRSKEVNVAPDLFGLATLAEIAANTEKLNQ